MTEPKITRRGFFRLFAGGLVPALVSRKIAPAKPEVPAARRVFLAEATSRRISAQPGGDPLSRVGF
jgi:hypothetical protein